jgi:thioester reductase-like protein
MQSNPMIAPSERWKRVYEKKGLLSEIDMDRIEMLVGDIKEPNFGLVEPIYRTLCTEVDAVFNLAVKVAFEEIYR